MSDAVTLEAPPLVFTSQAAAKVADLIAEEGNSDLKLRVYIEEEAARDSSTDLPLPKPWRTATPRLRRMVSHCWSIQ